MLLENNPYPSDVRVHLEAQSLYRAGYEVTVVAPRGKGEIGREVVDGIRVVRFYLPPFSASPAGIAAEYLVANLQLYLHALRHLRRIDIVHLHNPPDTLFPVGLLARCLNRRVVFDHHDIAPELFVEKFGERFMVKALYLLERFSYRVANSVLVVNDSLRDIALARGRVEPERIFVVRNAPRKAMIRKVTPPRKGALHDPHLVFVGSMASQDGVDLLPRLLRLLRERHGLKSARMTVVGDGPRRQPVERAMADAGLGNRVRFTGRVEHARIPSLLAEADMCVEPADCTDLNHRCSMVKIYEYMAAGRPIIAFPLREVRRLGGDDILYADCHDLNSMAALAARLAADGDLRDTLSGALRRRAYDFTWERSEAALLDAYAAL